MIESVGLLNHFVYRTEPSEVQSALPIRDDCTRLGSIVLLQGHCTKNEVFH